MSEEVSEGTIKAKFQNELRKKGFEKGMESTEDNEDQEQDGRSKNKKDSRY